MIKINYKKTLAYLVSFLFFIPMIFLSAAATLANPLRSNDVNGLLLSIMNLVATAGGVVVVLFIIYSGFKFVTAGDSDTDRTKAKDMFYYTVIGGAILLGADVIANVVVNTIKATTGART